MCCKNSANILNNVQELCFLCVGKKVWGNNKPKAAAKHKSRERNL